MRWERFLALAQNGLILLIQCYQHSLSIFFGPCCRFAPSCSSYAAQSIQRFGIVRGSWLSVRRLCKCHPFHPGGCDPVPEVNPERPLAPSLESMTWCSRRVNQNH